MPLCKYVGNLDPREGTGRIHLERSDEGVARELALGGAAIEISEDEYAQLCGRYRIEKVDEEDVEQTVPDQLVGRPFDLRTTLPAVTQPHGDDPDHVDHDTELDHSADGGGQEEHLS